MGLVSEAFELGTPQIRKLLAHFPEALGELAVVGLGRRLGYLFIDEVPAGDALDLGGGG